MRGVDIPLVLVEASGVAEPEMAGVPNKGRLLEIIPVDVRLNSAAGVDESESGVASCSECHVQFDLVVCVKRAAGLTESSSACIFSLILSAAAENTLERKDSVIFYPTQCARRKHALVPEGKRFIPILSNTR